MTIRKKNKFKWVLIITSFVMSVIMFAAMIVGLFVSDEDYKTLGRFDFKLGIGSDAAGKIITSERTIVTKNLYDPNDVEIEIEDSSKVEVTIFAYDSNGNQIGEYSWDVFQNYPDLDGDVDAITDIRIQIRGAKIDNEYPKLNFFNIGKYLDMVTIKVKK